MRNQKKSMRGKCGALLPAIVLSAAVPVGLTTAVEAHAQHQVAMINVTPVVVDAVRQINPTTVEVVYANGQCLTLDFYGTNIFRLFQDNAGGILREPQATPMAHILVNNARRAVGGLEVTTSETDASIRTERLSVDIDRQTGLLRVRDLYADKVVIEWAEPVAFEQGKVTMTLCADPEDYFYGGGVQNGRFSHKGKVIAIENTNNWVDGGVASPTPFYWSTGGYGVLWHTFRPGKYDFGATKPDRVILTHNEDYLDMFFMVNEAPTSLLCDFYQLTGNPVLLPKFGFYQGHLNAYNRDYWTPADNGFMLYEDGKRYNESQKDNGGIRETLNGTNAQDYQFSARAAIDRYFRNDMPLGWFLPNDGYGAGYGQTGTLDGNIQNLREFGEYARSKGVEIGLWTQSDLHPKEGVEALLQRDIVKEVRDAGVRVLKTDVAWVGAGYSFGLNGVADVGEIMPYYGSNARPFIISLDGWAGTQRYAGIWSGDQTGGDWEYIRFHIPTFIGSGLSGQPNITSDVDGIFGGKNVPVNVREFQWKTFTPMELNMDGWGSNPKYPEALGEPATSINRWYLKLKSELMPYTYTIARGAVDGKPMIRAMFLDYPNEYTLGTKTQYQYLFGPHFLVAPVYKETKMDKEGNDVRDGIYLPEGKWVDYWNGDVYEGGQIINNYPAPLWKLPVFVKLGAIIPMTNPNNNPTEIRTDYRAYEIYAGEERCLFADYDDDGKTQEYLAGASAKTPIDIQRDKKGDLLVRIGKTDGSFNGFQPEKFTELRINVSQDVKDVVFKANGKKVGLTRVNSRSEVERQGGTYYYDAAPELNRFATPGSEFAKVSIKKNPQLIVNLGKYDVTATNMEVTVKGFVFETSNHLLKQTGALQVPKVSFPEANVQAYEVTPQWEKQANADYYEVEFDGMRYSTITDNYLRFSDLAAETSYIFRVRAVNKDGQSEWATAQVTTTANPLEFAIQGIKASVTCEDQPGQTVANLFDFDAKSGWHTKWGKGEAVPFEMLLDLRSINQLDRIDYYPREDASNGTLIKGTVCYSSDKETWSEPVPFTWARNGEVKQFTFTGNPSARYLKIAISEAVGNFGSGTEMHVFKVADTESLIQGDINRDKRIDDNDLTSYMNYTGLRKGDGDFDYVSIGDINKNNLIDAYDISVVATELDGGVGNSNDKVSGALTITPDKKTFKAGDEIRVTVAGKDLHHVNALSFALPYDAQELEYAGLELVDMKEMVNLTNDRLHTNGTKALYPTFVNRGNNILLEEGNPTLFVIKFKAKRAGKWTLKAQDGLLVDRNLSTVKF